MGINDTCIGPSQASSGRLLVLEVSTSNDSKILKTVNHSDGSQILVVLCHEWQESAVETGHLVRVVLTAPDGTYQQWDSHQVSEEQPVLVTRECNILIHHPDTLIPSTAVADSFLCLRKSVVSCRTPSGNISDSVAGCEAALFGHLIHDMFQIILAWDANTRDSIKTEVIDWGTQGLEAESFLEAAEEALYRHHEDMFAAGVSDKDARLVLHKVTSDIMNWYRGFMGSGNYRGAEGVEVADGKLTRNIVVSEVHDIEELIWSPVFGLKGKIDATIHLHIDGIDVGIGILELKTGKSTGYAALYHSAQVTLYSMLLSDRKDRLVNHALLTYIPYQEALRAVQADQSQKAFTGEKIELLQTQSTVDAGNRHRYVVSSRAEIVGLVMQRNRLASYLRLESSIEDLPPLLTGKEQVCAKCFANESCLVQHKLIERGTSESVSEGPGASLYEKKTNHIRPGHEEYYRFWRLLLAQEREQAGREVKDIWSLDGEERERRGSCVSGLKLDGSTEMEPKTRIGLLPPGQNVEARFKRHPEVTCGNLGRNQLLASSGISEGDYVVVSAEYSLKSGKGCTVNWRATRTWQSALANGFVSAVSQHSITVTVERSLEAWVSRQGLEITDVSWRLDHQEVFSSYNVATKTLETLFGTDEVCGTGRIRKLVVDLKPPESRDEDNLARNQGSILKSRSLSEMNLNEDQESAVRMSLRAKDYVLILGMPGTGKTTTLVAIVLATALQGRSVLLCSHTNSAVDNLLRKLLDRGFHDFIRLGRNLDVIDSTVHPYHFSRKFIPGRSTDVLERDLQRPRVIATTCLGINHPLLVRRNKFDLVVVDEASQILQPICLGPLQFASGPFILVGDHYQLPPLQRTSTKSKTLTGSDRVEADPNHDWKNGHFKIMASGYDKTQTESLFRRLCVAHPSAMVALTKQYRMTEEIMDLANELVYGGSLTCGSPEVSKQALQVSAAVLGQICRPWIAAVLNPMTRVLFLDVESGDARNVSSKAQTVPGNEGDRSGSEDSSDRENESEASVVIRVLESLVEGGVASEDITVLSPFRAQVHLIRGRVKLARGSSRVDLSDVEVRTVDQYQGKDNSCVVVSFVRNRLRSIGPLLKDWRRLNVALTRAKKKLILVGSEATLRQGCNVLERMVTYLKEADRIYRVDPVR